MTWLLDLEPFLETACIIVLYLPARNCGFDVGGEEIPRHSQRLLAQSHD